MNKKFFEDAKITQGPWSAQPLTKGKFIIAQDDLSLLTITEEYDPSADRVTLWGCFDKKEDAQIAALSPEFLDALIDNAIALEYTEGNMRALRNISLIEKALPQFKNGWSEIKNLYRATRYK